MNVLTSITVLGFLIFFQLSENIVSDGLSSLPLIIFLLFKKIVTRLFLGKITFKIVDSKVSPLTLFLNRIISLGIRSDSLNSSIDFSSSNFEIEKAATGKELLSVLVSNDSVSEKIKHTESIIKTIKSKILS